MSSPINQGAMDPKTLLKAPKKKNSEIYSFDTYFNFI